MSVDIDPIRKRIESQRPIHWGIAAKLVRELEALRADNERLRALDATRTTSASGCDGSTLVAPPDSVTAAGESGGTGSGPHDVHELAAQLALIDLGRIGRREPTLIDGVVFRQARVVAAGLQGKGLIGDVKTALEHLRTRGAIECELPAALVSKCRPQRYRWATVEPIEAIQRFLLLGASNG